MARNFRVAQPKIIGERTLYQPPNELMMRALEVKDKIIDKEEQDLGKLKQYASMFQASDYFGEDKEMLQKILGGINDYTNTISQDMYKNPKEAGKYLSTIQDLQSNLLQSKTSGNIYHIEKRKKEVDEWLKENKDVAAKDPETFNRAKNYFIDQTRRNLSIDPTSSFTARRLVSSPDFTERFDKMLKGLKGIKYSKDLGRYILNGEIIDPMKVAGIINNSTEGDPMIMNSLILDKMIGGKHADAIDDKGNFRSFIVYLNDKGEVMTNEDIEAIRGIKDKTKRDQELNKIRLGLDPNNSLTDMVQGRMDVHELNRLGLTANPYGLAGYRSYLGGQREKKLDMHDYNQFTAGIMKTNEKDDLLQNSPAAREKLSHELGFGTYFADKEGNPIVNEALDKYFVHMKKAGKVITRPTVDFKKDAKGNVLPYKIVEHGNVKQKGEENGTDVLINFNNRPEDIKNVLTTFPDVFVKFESKDSKANFKNEKIIEETLPDLNVDYFIGLNSKTNNIVIEKLFYDKSDKKQNVRRGEERYEIDIDHYLGGAKDTDDFLYRISRLEYAIDQATSYVSFRDITNAKGFRANPFGHSIDIATKLQEYKGKELKNRIANFANKKNGSNSSKRK